MSLLDDFDVIEERANDDNYSTAWTQFFYDFILLSTKSIYERHQVQENRLGVSTYSTIKRLQRYFQPNLFSDNDITVNVSWDLSDWLKDNAKYCYIGFNYLCINDKCSIKFKLFDASKYVPKNGIVLKDYSWHLGRVREYEDTSHANELNGYKILSQISLGRVYEGWYAFDIDRVLKWMYDKPTSKFYYTKKAYPDIYKLIRYDWKITNEDLSNMFNRDELGIKIP